MPSKSAYHRVFFAFVLLAATAIEPCTNVERQISGMIKAASCQRAPKTAGISLGLTAANVAKMNVPATAARRTVRRMIGAIACCLRQ